METFYSSSPASPAVGLVHAQFDNLVGLAWTGDDSLEHPWAAGRYEAGFEHRPSIMSVTVPCSSLTNSTRPLATGKDD